MEKRLLAQNTEGERQEIRHPLHPDHPLALLDSDELEQLGVGCGFCGSGVTLREGVFGCEACKFYLHDVCAKSPLELQHPLHPTHPLKLRPSKKKVYGYCTRCRLCNRRFYYKHYNDKPVVYACDNTDNMCFEIGVFIMHVDCALLKLPSKKHPLHEHPLVSIKEYDCLANCAACGTMLEHSEYKATELYRCLECNIRIHRGCVDTPTKSELQAQSVQQWRSRKILHWLRPFSQLLEITVNEGDIECGLCGSLVNGPAYGREEISFFLHQYCAEMPKHFLHPMHEFALFINDNLKRDEFVCNLCHLTHEGDDFQYCYESQDKIFKMHPYCAALKPTWQHPNHKHPFVLIEKGHPLNSTNCPACGTKICSSSDAPTSYYLCWTCNISFHVRCFNSPSIVKRLDKHQHPLTLNFDPLPTDFDHNINYFCDACNEERDVHTYSYVCRECDYISHIQCDLFDKPKEVRYEEEDRKCQRLLVEQVATLDDIQKRIEWLEEELRSIKLLEEELRTLLRKKSACEEYINELRMKREEIRKMSGRY